MGYIYKVTNKENGKVYIGQTRHTIPWRWHTHLYGAFTEGKGDYNTLFHRAIRKYGIDAFIVEEIDKCKDSELNEKEIQWIERYGSCERDKGYNMTKGGEGNYKHKDDEIKELWEKGYSASEIAHLYPEPIGRNTVRTRLIGMGISEDEIRKRGNDAISRSKHKIIYQYSKDGEYIKSFYSASIAANEIKTNRANINACAAGNLKSAGGFLWSYEKKPKLESKKQKKGFSLVGKYNNKGVLLEAYVSLTAAGKNNGISRKRLAIACENGEQHNGFRWKYLNVDGGVIHV